MKKNFRSVMSAAFATLTMALAFGAFTSCQDDYYEPDHDMNPGKAQEAETSKGELKLKDGLDIYPLIYDSYMNDNDVEITSADTTTMSISAALLSQKMIDLKEGNVISVWRAREELPFMRQITGVTMAGDKVNVTTKDIQASEIIENANLEFDSEIYENRSLRATNDDGSINSAHFLSEKDGVYHPVAIFMHGEEEDAKMEAVCANKNGDEDRMLGSNYLDAEPQAANSKAVFGKTQESKKQVYIISELEDLRYDCGINLNGEVKNIKFPLVCEDGEKKDTVAWFGIEEATAGVTGGIHASLDISWFSVDKFEIGPYYSINAKVKPTLNATKKLPTWKKEYSIIKSQGYTSVFWVGPIPVSISFKPAITLSLEAKGTVTGSIGLEYTASGSNYAYAVYENGGWRVDKGGEAFHQDIKPVFGGTISASAKAAIYFKGDVMVYGVAGPSLKVGPYLQADAKASLKSDADIAAEAALKFGVDATVGAKLEVWNWKLAEWNKTVNLFEKEVWKQTWTLSDWIENTKKVAEETGNITDDMQKIIDDQADDEYIEEAIDATSEKKKFIYYMTAIPTKKAEAEGQIKDKFKSEWFEIEKNPTTFYDWDREFLLWYGGRFDKKVLEITSKRMLEDCFEISEFVTKSKFTDNVLKINMTNYILNGNADILSTIGADKCEALKNDWNNIRAEVIRSGSKSLATKELEAKFVTPWFEKYHK